MSKSCGFEIVKRFCAIFALSAAFVVTACSSDSSDNEAANSFSGVSIGGSSSLVPSGTLNLTASAKTTGSVSVSYEWNVTDGAELSATTGNSVTLTAGSTETAVTVTLTGKATVDGAEITKTASKKITISASANSISASDTPTGYATITPQTGSGTTVTTKVELLSAISNGGLIYVSGTIDMSEGCLPSTAGGTTAQLDAFVAANSSYSTYSAFKTAYAGACSASTNDKSSNSPESTYGSVMWTLNRAYGNKIKLNVKSNTTIIGLGNAVIKGGTIQISGVSNVTIRNLTIQDAYDPFPHHEKDDGFNAQWDGICLDGASNIWIDHCTIEDTMKYSNVTTKSGSEKWQTYDGLCDMKGSSKNIVVSYCIFKNHDKTMLIGSGSGDTSGGYITIHHNKFLNCGQRLPMTTYPNMHVYNNSFERDSDAYYSQQACIVGRYADYTYVVESNYFGSGVKKCLTKSTSAAGSCYSSGNYFAENSVTTELVTSTSTKPFTPSYEYELDEASDVPSIVEDNAGADVWSVQK
ncbi:MAG: right-handed parallel beta-helix repeat-containing protein [Treponema sp.]|nr:right-handed parallel beta-helix repeat-containing protein [Treponema sp.]